jgi:hypothetical protein
MRPESAAGRCCPALILIKDFQMAVRHSVAGALAYRRGLLVSQYTPATLIERRRDQMFPVLNPKQIAVARGFGGEPRRFQPAEIVFELGQLGAPAFLVLSGSIEVAKRDLLGHATSSASNWISTKAPRCTHPLS